MPTLRQKKRPASPVVNPEPDPPPKKTRSTKGRASKAEQNGDDEHQLPNKKAPAASKTKGKAIKAEPEDDDADVNVDAKTDGPKRKAAMNGKAKGKTVKAEPNDGGEDAAAGADADLGDDAKNSVSEKKGKSKTKVEPEAETNNEEAGSAQYAKSKNLVIPVDDRCTYNGHVYVDDTDGIIYDAALNQTNAGNNANKFYKVQLLTNGNDYRTWTRWGRVGESGQSALLGDGTLQDALSNFDKKFKDKSGLTWADRGKPAKPKKYVFVERSYEPDSEDDERKDRSETKGGAQQSRSASPAKCTLEAPVKSLMELVFNQQYMDMTMADMNYDAAKLPLGKLSKNTITRGYQALKDLSALFGDPSLAQSEHNTSYHNAMESLSNQYYSYIPHAFGRNRPPVISDDVLLKKEVQLLESLTDLKDADSILNSNKSADTIHPLDARFDALRLREVSHVDRKSDEFNNISNYLLNTRGATHGHTYDLIDLFRIERDGEMDRFQKYAKSSGDRRLLWHGSRSTNYGGILSQGLRIAPPEAPVSGYMFGKGVYLADMSSKSANYCHSYLSGNHALLLLCEAELGAPLQELTNASYTAGEDAVKNGLISTWGKGSTGPVGWKDANCVHPDLAGVKMPDTTTLPTNTGVPGAYLQYNEFICYDVAQIRLRYLLRVKM